MSPVNPESGVSAMLVNMCGQISRGIGHNCPSSVIQLAAADCCDLTSDLSVYETNMNILYDALTDLGFDIVRPGGTFYLFPKALEDDAAAFSKKALPYGLILVPSDSFGVPGYFRIAFCTDTEKIVRLHRRVQEIRKSGIPLIHTVHPEPVSQSRTGFLCIYANIDKKFACIYSSYAV